VEPTTDERLAELRATMRQTLDLDTSDLTDDDLRAIVSGWMMAGGHLAAPMIGGYSLAASVALSIGLAKRRNLTRDADQAEARALALFHGQ